MFQRLMSLIVVSLSWVYYVVLVFILLYFSRRSCSFVFLLVPLISFSRLSDKFLFTSTLRIWSLFPRLCFYLLSTCVFSV